jgi:outer membrane beta-barrel protein
MDNRIKRILLDNCAEAEGGYVTSRRKSAVMALALFAGLLIGGQVSRAAETDGGPGAVQVIKPEVVPREVTEADIDDEFFEIGLFVGNLNIDNFGSELVYGANASFHATEDFFLQINYGMSEAGLTSFEELSGQNVRLLSDSERDYTFYNLLVGYNIFPGEVFMTSKLTFNSAFFLVGGIGNTEFGGEDNFTVTVGTGYRIVLRDWLTWHIDYRDHIFNSDILKEDQTTHNIELSTGLTLFF